MGTRQRIEVLRENSIKDKEKNECAVRGELMYISTTTKTYSVLISVSAGNLNRLLEDWQQQVI